MIQAALLGLYKSKLFSASGEGSKSRFYMTHSESPFKFVFRVRTPGFELIAAFVISLVFWFLSSLRAGLGDALGLAVSAAICIFYTMRFFRILHLGSLVNSIPHYLNVFGLLTMPWVRGTTTFIAILSGGYSMLFFYRLTGHMEYPSFEVDWSFTTNLLSYPVWTGILLAFLWVVGCAMVGETRNSSRIIKSNNLQALFDNERLMDSERVNILSKGYGLLFGLFIAFCGAYAVIRIQWV
jgi:hypothetical protein